MRIGRELLRRQLAVLAPDEVVECASSSTSIAATPGRGMCAAEAAGLSANRASANRASANRRAFFGSGGRWSGVGVLFRARAAVEIY